MFSDPGVDKESDTAKPSTGLTTKVATSANPLPQGKQFKKQLVSYFWLRREKYVMWVV